LGLRQLPDHLHDIADDADLFHSKILDKFCDDKEPALDVRQRFEARLCNLSQLLLLPVRSALSLCLVLRSFWLLYFLESLLQFTREEGVYGCETAASADRFDETLEVWPNHADVIKFWVFDSHFVKLQEKVFFHFGLWPDSVQDGEEDLLKLLKLGLFLSLCKFPNSLEECFPEVDWGVAVCVGDLLQLQQDVNDCTALIDDFIQVSEGNLNEDLDEAIGSLRVTFLDNGLHVALQTFNAADDDVLNALVVVVAPGELDQLNDTVDCDFEWLVISVQLVEDKLQQEWAVLNQVLENFCGKVKLDPTVESVDQGALQQGGFSSILRL
jgi:hypothetical protein